MAKRKAGVNDIIYELDNDDIELSSEDEHKEGKIGRFDNKNSNCQSQSIQTSVEKHNEVIKVDSSSDSICDISSSNDTKNGGKNTSHTISKKTDEDDNEYCPNELDVNEIDNTKNGNVNKTLIFDEDIAVDSPASNSDIGVVGCENRTPLVTVRFKDSTLAHTCKKRVKEFLISLLKSHSGESVGALGDSDTELDIWPEDLVDEEFDNDAAEDNLFFIDRAPCDESQTDVPKYSQNSSIISNSVEEEEEHNSLIPLRRKLTCFNCDGEHQLRDCTLPRNNMRIAAKRKTITRIGRYHVEDDQKYGHLVPGRISGNLRHALGLKRYELPLHIYRMRLLGYPPGWLEEARISHSGITMFDSTGSAIQDPEEEDGELLEPGSKDKFDIKKILDFPGFNVPASSHYLEEGHLFGLPPMSDQDSKMAMLQTLAPNAMKAYKRKKLSFFPSASQNFSQEGQAEMELDSGDEIVEFPSIPPLPDEAPPLVVVPPPPPPEDEPKVTSNNTEKEKPENNTNIINNNLIKNDKVTGENKYELDTSDSELEVIEVLQVNDIPIPEDDLITIDDDDDDKSQLSSRSNSPGLDALEEKKRCLLDALKGDITIESDDLEEIPITDLEISESKTENEGVAISKTEENKQLSSSKDKIEITPSLDDNVTSKSKVNDTTEDVAKSNNRDDIDKLSVPTPDVNTPSVANNDSTKTIDKSGHVKTTLYGTPILNVASSYVKLPSDDKFAKNICDIINFENLPNSTGKYKQICTLLKKVKSEVDRIQES